MTISGELYISALLFSLYKNIFYYLMITIDYNLLKPYKEGPFEVNVINDSNAIRLQNLISQSKGICQTSRELYFWARLINYPEDLGLFVDWVLVQITGFPQRTSIIIDFREYSNVLGEWEFKNTKSYSFPDQIAQEHIKDISPLLNRLEDLVKEIRSDPFGYTQWVLNNIPIIYRTGTLDIDDYFKICPEEDPSLTEEELKEYNTSSPHYLYDNLTIRKYVEIFVSIHSKMTGLSRDHYGGDIKYYQSITGETDLLQLYPDLDSPQEFFKFCTQVYGQSCRFDLVPTKIRLVPVVVGTWSQYVYTGLWQILLNIYDRDYIKFALKGWFVKKKEVYLKDEDKITKYIHHKGKILFKPDPFVGIRTDNNDIYIEGIYPLEEPSRINEIKKLITFNV